MKTLNEKKAGKTVSLRRIMDYMTTKGFDFQVDLNDLLIFGNKDFYYIYIFVEPKMNNEYYIKSATWCETN